MQRKRFFSIATKVGSLAGKGWARTLKFGQSEFCEDYTIIVAYKDFTYRSGKTVSEVAKMLQTGRFRQGSSWKESQRQEHSTRGKGSIAGRSAFKKWPYEEQVFAQNRSRWSGIAKGIIRRIINGKQSRSPYYDYLSIGHSMVNMLKARIYATRSPSLEKTTEKKKLKRHSSPYFNHPLIETERLVNSIYCYVIKTSTFKEGLTTRTGTRYVQQSAETRYIRNPAHEEESSMEAPAISRGSTSAESVSETYGEELYRNLFGRRQISAEEANRRSKATEPDDNWWEDEWGI